MKKIILPLLLFSSLYGEITSYFSSGNCQYKKNGILYRDTENYKNIVTLKLQLQPTHKDGLYYIKYPLPK